MAEAASGRVDVPFYQTGQDSDEEDLHRIFNEISRVLKMEEFDDELKALLEKGYPAYLENLQKREDDLMRKDCAVVITGETSAGKSSIINLLLKTDTDILPEGVEATTTAICKIKYSDEKKILVFDRKGVLITEEIPDSVEKSESPVVDSDFLKGKNKNTKRSGRRRRKKRGCLQNSKNNKANPDSRSAEMPNANVHDNCENNCNDSYTILERIFKSDPEVGVHCVEVCHPIRILKGKIMIVDTPGVGDNDELNYILEEYLPHAVAFVFVVDPTRGGGMQDDRILKVLRKIQKSKDKMICFNESDVIFAVNKWDAVFTKRQSETPWLNVVAKIKKVWPQVNPDNIIKMSAKQVHTGEGEQILHENFKTFERALRTLIEKNVNIRIQEHHRFVSQILSTAVMFVKSAYKTVTISLPELCKEIERCNQRLKDLKDKSVSAKGRCEKILEDALKEHGRKLKSYVTSNEFKDLILTRQSDLSQINRTSIGSMINKRIEDAITEWIEENESSITDEVDNFIKTQFHEIQQELDDILGRFGCTTQQFDVGNILSKEFSNALKSWFYGFGVGVLSFSIMTPIWSIPVCATAAVVAVGVSYIYAKGLAETAKLSIAEVIKTSFETRQQAITLETISKMLDKKYAQRYRKLFDELFAKRIPIEIEKSKKMINKLATDRDTYEHKKEALHKLSCELDEISKQLKMCLSTEV